MKKVRCDGCAFGVEMTGRKCDPPHDDDSRVKCKRYPAVFIGIPDPYDPGEEEYPPFGEGFCYGQPIMFGDDWCGEHSELN